MRYVARLLDAIAFRVLHLAAKRGYWYAIAPDDEDQFDVVVMTGPGGFPERPVRIRWRSGEARQRITIDLGAERSRVLALELIGAAQHVETVGGTDAW